MAPHSPDPYPALARYARLLHHTVGDGHHVASPLGAWLLLALCASAAAPTDRLATESLRAALGTDLAAARAAAADLLEHPHPLVSSAAGMWHRMPSDQPMPAELLARLPERVTVAELPSQRELDAWADRATGGLIQGFPVTVTPLTALIVATALATKVTWQVPFQLVPAELLGADHAWVGQITQALRAASPHQTYLCTTPQAGDVAVHQARAVGGLLVLSVVGGREVPPAEVLAAGYDLARAAATGVPVARRSLFDLPLGDTPLWSVTEGPGPVDAPGGRAERCTAVLPAWSATATHDLGDESLGFPTALRELARRLGLADRGHQARQAVVARYSRTGFEAAAVSAVGLLGCVRQASGVIRQATIRFRHPFAAVAVPVTPAGAPASPWHGLPVFSAWVARADESAATAADPAPA